MNDREKLISDNLGLVHSCANRFKNRGIEYDDLFQAGCVGLIKAADGFNDELGFQFSTYAVPAILGEIKRIFRDGGAVKVSRALKEKARFVAMEKERYVREYGFEPSVKELAEFLNLSTAETAELLLVTMPPVSLTADDENGEKQFDIPIMGEEEKIAERLTLDDCLSSLSENDRAIIELRYFKGETQTVVAKKLGMTQVQVSRREKVILKEMRTKMAV
ncbi:MAG: sigma-70 family RNA polymerase sigma factor [Ruminococcaceae bacterium]|nr:sigma-70 family RNA polymerase sigma factor [Oscillospiraceae bacterium]